MAGVPGVAARLFGAIAGARISVTMISQSSSESSICLAVPGERAIDAEQTLKREFRADIARGDVDEIVARRGVSLDRRGGARAWRTRRASRRACSARSARARSQRARGRPRLLRAQHHARRRSTTRRPRRSAPLHEEFGLRPHRHRRGHRARGFDLILLGLRKDRPRAGASSSSERRAHIFDRFGLDARIVAVADRTGFLVPPRRASRHDELSAILDAKAGGASDRRSRRRGRLQRSRRDGAAGSAPTGSRARCSST